VRRVAPVPLTIVAYHYVRDLERSRFPEIKGLTVDEFRGQLDYLERHYAFVRLEDLLSALSDPKAALPSNAVLLTFDDGYIDHFTNVFPILQDRGIQGLFFPPAQSVLEDKVLDVNKIHFILAAVRDKAVLVETIRAAVEENRRDFGIEGMAAFWERYARPSRFDGAEVAFVKRMLQAGLPEALRRRVTDELFRTHVCADEAAFARELYMTADQIRLMVRSGMYVGSHGYGHHWMDGLSPEEQRYDIARSLDFLALVGAPTRDWVMCYPHGRLNDSLVRTLVDHGCAVGLTTVADIARPGECDPLRLPRLDTNNLPKTADAPPNAWTEKAFAAGREATAAVG